MIGIGVILVTEQRKLLELPIINRRYSEVIPKSESNTLERGTNWSPTQHFKQDFIEQYLKYRPYLICIFQ